MLDKYIEELVKTARSQEKLDTHLEKLASQAKTETEMEDFLRHATVGELAKLAGITLPENVCTKCGNTMEKLGSIFQCECGMMKKALVPLGVAMPAARLGGRQVARAAVPVQTAAQKSAPLLTGAGGGNLTANELASAQGPMQRMATGARQALGGLKQRVMGMGGGGQQLVPKTASVKTAIEKCSECGGGLAKSGEIVKCAQCGSMTKSASIATFNRAVNANGGNIDRALTQLEYEGYTKLAFNPSAAWAGAKALGSRAVGAVTGKAKQVAQTYQTASRGLAPGGVMRGVKAVAQQHPGVAAGVAGAGGLGAGYMLGKTGAAEGGGINPGWLQAQKGMRRASLAPGSRFFAHPDLVQSQALESLKGMAIGGGIGAGVGTVGGALASLLSRGRIGLGTGAGVGAGIGGLGGLGIGDIMGSAKADKAFLAKRGVIPHWGGLRGATFTPEAASKYLSKTSSATLLEVGDAAGRIMAKCAEGPEINPEEVAEAIEEAKEREDVPGRSRAWGIGGGALGGLAGGGLGYAVPRLLGANPWAKGIGAGLGALAGGIGGAYLGSQEGGEEAQADRLVSFLRGRRAYGTGADEGYQAGLQQGYMAGLTQGGMGENEEGPQ